MRFFDKDHLRIDRRFFVRRREEAGSAHCKDGNTLATRAQKWYNSPVMKDEPLKKLNTRDIVRIALAVALNAICAFITIPSTVPFTLQVFGIFFTLEFLGGKRGAIAVWLYLLFGAVGLPVFSGFRGGFGVLLSATGGFIMAFAAVALLYFVLSFFETPAWMHYVAAAFSLLLIYVGGSTWFVFMMGGTLTHALLICVVPFILPDVLKITLGFFLSSRLHKALTQRGAETSARNDIEDPRGGTLPNVTSTGTPIDKAK